MPNFLTPEEIQAESERLVKAFQAGAISAKDLNEGLNDCKKGVQGYTAAMQASLNQLGTSSKKFFEGALQGKTGMSQYNDIAASGADAVANAAMQFGPLGIAIGVLIKVISFGVSEVNKQADTLMQGYQDMAKVGTMGDKGMTGVFDSMRKFGYGVNQMTEFTALMAANSESLAQFGEGAIDGAKKFANVANAIKTSDLQLQFMNMGLSVDEMNKGIGRYISTQTELGIKTADNSQDIAKSAADYMMQQDRITKITGMNADQQDASRKQAEQIELFNAAKLRDPAHANEMQAAFDSLYAKSKTMALAYAAAQTGMSGLTKESIQGQQQTGGQLNILSKQYKDNLDKGMDSTQALAIFNQGIADASASTIKFHTAAAAVGGDPNMGGLLEQARIAAGANGKVSKAILGAKDAQQAQVNNMNKETNALNKTQQEQMNTRDAFQGLVNKGLGPTLTAFGGLQKIINAVFHPVDSLNKTIAAWIGPSEQPPPEAPGKPGEGLEFGSDSGSKANFDKLDGPLKGAVERAAAEYHAATGKLLKINSAWRDPAKQQQLYQAWIASGKQGKPVAPPGKSNHEKGQAVDIQNYSDPAAVKALNNVGLFAKVANDPVHFSQTGFEKGGISAGPKSGYQALLHGTEAIIPMNDKKEITVQNHENDDAAIIAEQNSVIADIIALMRSQNRHYDGYLQSMT